MADGISVENVVAAAVIGETAENSGAATTGGTALYVGDLDLTVTEHDLNRLFEEIGKVISLELCMDVETNQFLGYAYVNYNDAKHAKKALEELNFTYVNGKPIRISYFYKNASYRRNLAANIFVKNLDKSIDNKEFYGMFSSYGNIVSSKVETNNSSGESKGFGYVQFETEESARKAIEEVNGVILHGKEVYVGPFVSKEERKQNADKTKYTNVFVKNLSEQISEQDLRNIFGEFGSLKSLVVMREEDGKSKCFGFVDFEKAEDAMMAVEALNGKLFDGKQWYVGRAKKKAEREQELKILHRRIHREDLLGFNNLYVKNLDDSINDEKLKELFASFGTITSCKVMRDAKGISRGSGFVAFSTIPEASNAILEMNGKMLGRKPLYVAIAEKKEARKARFQAIFSNKLPHTIMPTLAPHVPIYPPPPPPSPGLLRQIFHGPAFVPRLPGFGYQPKFVPGPNMFFPMVQRGPQFGRLNSPAQLPFPMMQQAQFRPVMMDQQMISRGNGFHVPIGYGMPKCTNGYARGTTM